MKNKTNICFLTDEHVALISVIAVFWLSSNHGSVFRRFLCFLFFRWFTGSNHLTSATKHRKVKRFMRGMKQLLCFSWYSCVSGSGWKRKSHQKVPQRSLYLHNKNASFGYSVVKSAFQNLPQRLVSRICYDLPSFRQFMSQFLDNRRVSGRLMSIELRAEVSFLELFMKASSKMKCGETELCLKKEFLFSTTKHLKIYH